MYRKIAFVLVLCLVLVFFSQFGYAAGPRYHDQYRNYYAPDPYSNPKNYDHDTYGYNPYGYSYPFGEYQQAPPWESKKWQLHERRYEEGKPGEDW